ncbi:hypothetical protein [Mycolicibacterium palauense]|uniref:hypothetical protein n=1 Tax=Mycolicibacterium palauense TaxID=2034511 RepID=UPI000BFEB25A|nr:hypothetical protein [Mycolicibacterium palauense]
MSDARFEDMARAARLVSALASQDHPGVGAVLREAKADGRLVQLALALALRHIQVCSEYYDVDTQQILDELAFDANAMAFRERHGDQ